MQVTVVVEGKLRGIDDAAALSAFADQLMETLIDEGAVDPFVFTDAGVPSFHVDVAIEAPTESLALQAGVSLITDALEKAGAPVEAPSARAGELVPA